ncbi:unnamed protein product, partial [Staurois parvus]
VHSNVYPSSPLLHYSDIARCIQYLLSPQVPHGGGEGVFSQRWERTSPAPVPSAAVQQKPETGSCKPELGFTMRLGAQVHRSPQRNFSSHLASGRAAFSSPVL